MDKTFRAQILRYRSTIQLKREKSKRKPTSIILIITFAIIILMLLLLTPQNPLNQLYSAYSIDSDENTSKRMSVYTGLVISEIMSSNAAAVTDENGAHADWIEIWNSSEHEINLFGLGLSDRGDKIQFLFPNVSLPANDRIVIFCDGVNQVVQSKPFHAKFKLSSVGETIYLFDPRGIMIDSCKYPIMAQDESWSLMEQGFQSVKWFSPGLENTPKGHQVYREMTSFLDGKIVINEVMADPVTGIRDDENELADWIELFNTTDHNIALNAYSLSDNERKPQKWQFPDNATIPSHGYYLVLCTGKNRQDTKLLNTWHTNFRISSQSETIILSDNQGHIIDRMMIDQLPADNSWGRNDQAQMQHFSIATPLLPNNQYGFDQMDLIIRSANKTGIWISEIMASNSSVITYPNGAETDWIEIYNASAETVDLTNWGLSDNLSRGRKWQFPEGTTITPGEYKIILCDGEIAKNSSGELHTSFRISRQKGEIITLTDPTGQVLDKVILPEMKTDISFGRIIGLAGLHYFADPTPFQANGNGFDGYAENPTFSLEPGQYSGTQYIEIRIPEGTQVYYTTDGSTPTQLSTPYNGERLELNFTTVLRARAFGTGNVFPSDTLTGTFFINAYHSLPLISIVTDPQNLWDSEWGMLTVGEDAVKDKLPFKNTVYRKVKKAGIKYESNIEIYNDRGALLLNQGGEIALMGDYSLDMPQKSFKFRAKSKYGSKTFDANLFPDRDYADYKGFVLRNSGNDSMWTRLQDGFQSRLMDLCETTIAHQAWKPYAVYLNGSYWGHMNLRERTDRYMIAQFEGLSFEEAGTIDLLQGNGEVKSGSNKAFKAMLKKIKAGDPAKNPDDLQYILDNVDVDNLFEYMAFEMFFGNSDIGNTRFYRTNQPGSKWKWILYDVDYGLYRSNFNSPWSYTKKTGMGEKNFDNTIFVKLLSIPEYRERYLTVYGNIYRKLTTNFMIATLNEMVELIEPEMQLHWARWGEENDKAVIAEVPTTVDGAYRYWQKRVERLRNVCRLRPNRLWGYTQDTFNLTNAEMEKYFGSCPEIPADAVID